ncbi:MAG: polysaccharide deacetylase family protein [Parahaliea sp.]
MSNSSARHGRYWPHRALSPVLGKLCGAGSSHQHFAILNYHRVLPKADPLCPSIPSQDEFRWQMQLLAETMTPLPLHEAIERQSKGDLPPRAVCVTFDDGYADNADVAYPVLKDYAIAATIFVATAFRHGGQMWNDALINFVRNANSGSYAINGIPFQLKDNILSRRQSVNEILLAVKHLPMQERQAAVDTLLATSEAITDNPMMTESQLKQLDKSLISIGAHTVNHPILQSISDEEALWEISESRRCLQQLLGCDIDLFAYPNGVMEKDFSDKHIEMLKETGYKAAVTTHKGIVTRSCNRFLMPRFTPWDKTPARFLGRLLLNYRNRH